MNDQVSSHYSREGALEDRIVQSLQRAGIAIETLKTSDLTPIDEFHIRGRKATLELANQMRLTRETHVLDIGSGLGGPARTLAETYGCRVTGIDLTQAFCDAAEKLSDWVNLSDLVSFTQGDATDLTFADETFDAAMTIHVAMNIPAKDKVYAHARRVVKPGGIFAIYDILQGEGGDVLFPVPWAREPSISHLAKPDEMHQLLTNAGFKILQEQDSTEESLSWFEAMATRMQRAGPSPLTFREFLGDDFPEMTRNQVRNLTERRIRTVTFICEA